MARYNQVQIGSIYLTSTGANGGKPCKVTVTGLGPLKTTKTGQVINSANGTPYAQLINFSHKGLPIRIITDWMTKTVFDNLVSAIESALNSPSSIAIVVTGDTGTFSFNAIPMVPDTIDFEGFSNNYIKGASFGFMTT